MRITIEPPKINQKTNIRKGLDWKNFINKQKYLECQVITAINAFYYLTGNYIDPNSFLYENLVNISEARYAPAHFIDKVHKKLGIVIKRTYDNSPNYTEFPLEKTIGMHSVLIVNSKNDSIQVTNMGLTDGWIKKTDFLKYTSRISKTFFRYKLFGLEE